MRILINLRIKPALNLVFWSPNPPLAGYLWICCKNYDGKYKMGPTIINLSLRPTPENLNRSPLFWIVISWSVGRCGQCSVTSCYLINSYPMACKALHVVMVTVGIWAWPEYFWSVWEIYEPVREAGWVSSLIISYTLCYNWAFVSIHSTFTLAPGATTVHTFTS